MSTELDRPLSDLALDLAAEVVGALEAAGLEPFLIDHGHHAHLGLRAEDRRVALRALRSMDAERHWYLRWRRGHRWHEHLLRARRSSGAARAESWRLFRCASVGPDVVAGPEEAVELSFWTVGAEGRLERLGLRGLHRFEANAERTNETIGGRRLPGISAFPVATALGRFRDPVDVVYTWVDGDDPTWRAEFDHWMRLERPAERGDHATHAARYTSHDELRYSLRSLWLNAGWVRRIYVVTADQQPWWLCPDDRLVIVPHRDILPASALPTFNSHAIESRLHHIDGLAEHFVYFNDDMFLGRSLLPRDFFDGNGNPVFFESEARIPSSRTGADLAVDTAARRGRELIERDFRVTVTHKLHHAPYALRRSVMAEVEERYADIVTATTHSRFRHPEDLSIPSAFAHHFGFVTGRSAKGDLRVAYENLGSRRLGLFLDRLRLGHDVDAFCINETERWETDPVRAATRLGEFLEAYFPVPSPWEPTERP